MNEFTSLLSWVAETLSSFLITSPMVYLFMLVIVLFCVKVIKDIIK